MPRARRFNWKLLVVVVIGAVVLASTGYGLRKWNRTVRAEKGLAIGIEAYENAQWQQAASQLGVYLANTPNHPDKIPVIMKYAQAQLNIRPLTRSGLDQAIESYRVIQRIEIEFNMPLDQRSDAVDKLAAIYLFRSAPEEAEMILNRALQERPSLSLRKLYAQSLAKQRKFQESINEYRAILQDYPTDILTYEAIGLLTEMRRQEFVTPAQYWFDQAVTNNPDQPLAYIIRSEHFFRSNKLDQAEQDLAKAMQYDYAEDFPASLRLINLLLMANKLDKAEFYLEASGKIKPDDQNLWHLWALLALQSGDKEKQIGIARRGIETMQNDPWDFMCSAIELFLAADEYDLAKQYIEKLREKEIALGYVAYFDGRIAEHDGNYFEALRSWNQASQNGLNTTQLRMAMARVAAQLGNDYEAMQHLQKIIESQPNNIQARLKLATIYSQTGHWKEVEEHAQWVSQIKPDNLLASLLILKARVHRLTSEAIPSDSPLWGAVENDYQTLESKFAGSPEVGIEKIRFANLRKQYAKARQLSNTLLEQYPDDPQVHLVDIQIDLAQNQQQQAKTKLLQAIKRFDQSMMFDKILAQLYFNEKQFQKCKATLEAAIERVQNPLFKRKLQLQLVRCFQGAENTEMAYTLLRQLEQNFPQDIGIKAKLLKTPQVRSDPERAQALIEEIKTIEGFEGNRWRFEQAHFWYYQQDFFKHETQIIENLKVVLIENPTDTAAQMLLAKTYERSGKINLALMTYREALNKSPNNIDLMVLYSVLLYRTQDYDHGDVVLDQARKLNPSHEFLNRLELFRHLRLGQIDSATALLRQNIEENPDHPDNIKLQILLVRLSLEQKKLQEASQRLAHLRQKAPDSLEVLELCIDLSLLQNDKDAALQFCSQLLTKSESPAAYYLRARTYARLNRIDDAIMDIEKTTSLQPDNIDIWIEKSRFYSNLGLQEQALTTINHALNMNEQNLTVMKLAIDLLLMSNHSQNKRRGHGLLKQALRINPQDLELRLIKARLLVARSNAMDIEQAESILSAIVEQQPLTVQAWILLTQVYLNSNQPGKALNTIMQALAKLPNNKTLLYLKSHAEMIHSPHLAISTLKEIHEQHPNDVDVVLRLAGLYADDHQPDKAIELLQNEKNNHHDPENKKKINLALITMMHLKGQTEEAYRQLEQLGSPKTDVDVYLTYMDLYLKDQRWQDLAEQAQTRITSDKGSVGLAIITTGQLARQADNKARSEAELLYRLLLEHEPQNTQILSAFGLFLHQDKKFEESATIYKKILDIDPQHITAINNRAWILAAELKEPDTALQLANQGLDIEPDYADLLDTRGYIYSQKGDYKKAVRDYEHCLSLYHNLHPSQASVYLRLAQALAALNRNEQAKTRLQKAQALNQSNQTLSSIEVQQMNQLLLQLR